MKAFLFLSAVLAVALANEGKTYTTKYDNVNVEEILNNDRLLDNYFKCIMDMGPCTPDGSELKSVIPDALQTECSKCNEKQRDGTDKVIKFLIENKPELWDDLQKKYDPEGTYYKKYQSEAEKHNIKLPAPH